MTVMAERTWTVWDKFTVMWVRTPGVGSEQRNTGTSFSTLGPDTTTWFPGSSVEHALEIVAQNVTPNMFFLEIQHCLVTA